MQLVQIIAQKTYSLQILYFKIRIPSRDKQHCFIFEDKYNRSKKSIMSISIWHFSIIIIWIKSTDDKIPKYGKTDL